MEQKLEIRSTKFETISNVQNRNRFGHSIIRILNLFRISDFGLRIFCASIFLLLVIHTTPVFAAITFKNPLTSNTGLLAIICTVADRVLSLAIGVAVIALVLSGGLYLFSGGNAQRITTARKMFIAAIIGSLFALTAVAVPGIVASLFAVPASSLPSSCT